MAGMGKSMVQGQVRRPSDLVPSVSWEGLGNITLRVCQMIASV